MDMVERVRRAMTSPQTMITAATAIVASIGVLVTLIFTTVSDIVSQTHELREQIKNNRQVTSAELKDVTDTVDNLGDDIAGIDIPAYPELPTPQVNVTTPKGETRVIVRPATPAPAPATAPAAPAPRPRPRPAVTPSPKPSPGLLDFIFPPKS